MLDKSIPFHQIVMRCGNDRPPVSFALPEGFSIRPYQEGDASAWATIQTAVGEFPNRGSALECFRHYLAQEGELRRRQVYAVETATGRPVATATAWFSVLDGEPIGVVHALSCLPEYQALGLGKAVASRMMRVFWDLMPGRAVWLDTQTWSYRAIGLYLELWFAPMKTAVFNEARNEFAAAASVLKEKMRADKYRLFLETAG